MVTCTFGFPWNVHLMEPGCLWCAAESERLHQEFLAAVARGEFDAEGWTPNERKAQQRKQGA